MKDSQETNLRSRAIGGAVWVFAEKFGAQFANLIVSIVLARLLLPEDYSTIGVVTIFFAFCNVFITGGLNTALIQKKNADPEDYSTILHISMGIAGLFYLLIFFLAPWIAGLYEQEILIPVFRVMGVLLFLNSFRSVLTAYVSNTLRFKLFFYSTIVSLAISAPVGILMAYEGFGVWALVTQQIVSAVVATAVLFFSSRFRILFVVSYARFVSLFRYGWKIFATSVIGVAYEEASPLIIGLRFETTDLSYYTKGRSFPALLNTTITGTMATVLFPVMAKVQDDKGLVLRATRRYIRLASYIVFPMMVGFFAVSENFVRVVLTEKWIAAVPYIQIFCISYMFNIIQTGNLEAIKAVGRSDISLILEIIKKSLYAVVIVLFVVFADSPIALAISAIVCTAIATLVNTFPNRKLLGYRYGLQAIDLLPNLVLAGIMGVCVWGMSFIDIAPVVLLVLQILGGAAVYLLLSVVTRNENFKYFVATVKGRLKGVRG